MVKKVTKEDLAGMISQGAEVQRLPSSLESCIEALRVELKTEAQARRAEAQELRDFFKQVIDRMACDEPVDVQRLIDGMASVVAARNNSGYEVKINRDERGVLEGAELLPKGLH